MAEKWLGKFSQYRKQQEGVKNTDMNIGPAMGQNIKDTSAPEIGQFKKGVDEVKAKKQPIPSEIADQLQTDKNERAAKAYEARKAAGKEDEFKKGGSVKSKCACGGGKMAKGGMARSSASKRADGIAIRGKTRA